MTYESDWDGFAMLGGSGVVEALDAAGVDCSVRERSEQAEAETSGDHEPD